MFNWSWEAEEHVLCIIIYTYVSLDFIFCNSFLKKMQARHKEETDLFLQTLKWQGLPSNAEKADADS